MAIGFGPLHGVVERQDPSTAAAIGATGAHDAAAAVARARRRRRTLRFSLALKVGTQLASWPSLLALPLVWLGYVESPIPAVLKWCIVMTACAVVLQVGALFVVRWRKRLLSEPDDRDELLLSGKE